MKISNTVTIGIVVIIILGLIFVTYSGQITPSVVSCSDDFNCPTKMKCENAVCVDVGCLEEGGLIPGTISPEYLEHMATECCEGLTQITYSGNFDENCNEQPLLGGPAGVCSDCGNGICEEWETKCNCPEDCEITTTTTTTLPATTTTTTSATITTTTTTKTTTTTQAISAEKECAGSKITVNKVEYNGGCLAGCLVNVTATYTAGTYSLGPNITVNVANNNGISTEVVEQAWSIGSSISLQVKTDGGATGRPDRVDVISYCLSKVNVNGTCSWADVCMQEKVPGS